MTPGGHALYETSPMKPISEMEEIRVQRVGTREDSEKMMYEPNTSRERHYETTM